MNSVTVAPREQVFNDVKNARVRHIVEKDETGAYKDEALCGFVWDMLKPPPNGSICEECYEIWKEKTNG